MTKREHSAMKKASDSVIELKNIIEWDEELYRGMVNIINNMSDSNVEEIRSTIIRADELKRKIDINKRVLDVLEAEYVEATNE